MEPTHVDPKQLVTDGYDRIAEQYCVWAKSVLTRFIHSMSMDIPILRTYTRYQCAAVVWFDLVRCGKRSGPNTQPCCSTNSR
jgi:hypothetical protein